MDDADHSDEIEDRIKDLVIAVSRKAADEACTLNPSGVCLNCGERCGTDRRWCSIACRDEWQEDQALRDRLHAIGFKTTV